MLRRIALRTAQQASAASASKTRSFATSQIRTTSKKKQPSAVVLAAAGVAAVTGYALTDLVNAREKPVDLDAIKKEIIEIFDEDNYMGPTMVRLAWHSSGTYKKKDGSGGSSGGTIRFKPEIDHGGNAGLHLAVKALEKVKRNHPEISYADLYVLAGVAMIEEMGGPEVPFRLGRSDAKSGNELTQTPDDRLPNADMGSKDKTTSHVRDVFYRMGFDDRDIVALVGAHAIGRCYPTRSGYSGPWTNAEWTFSNEFFRELIENKWTIKKWNGPEQYEDPTGKLMMLPADIVMIQDPKFKKYVEMYAKDEDLWFKDFSKAFVKLTENGVKFEETSGWRKFFGGKRRDLTLPYEETYPWEDEHGTTADRTIAVNTEAKRVYAEQEKLLPTVAQDKPLDPIATEHLQDVGRRVLILRDTTKRSRMKKEDEQNLKQSPKRVIPSRFPEVTTDLDEEDASEADRVEVDEDPAVMEGRIATMLMDQEWDTRGWNTTKIHTTVDTLYEEIENSEDDSRRKLATTMLLRLLETHEDAVDYVETTLPSLTNKAFRTLSKLTDNTKIFRVVLLVSVLAEWFTSVLSNQSAVTKSITCLQRETELCARILQHHWRGVLFERTVSQRDYDPIVRTRLRSMHMIKFVELRHQFRVFREAIGPSGIPSSAKEAYITILCHLVKLPREPGSVSDKMRSTVLADQRRILGSGVLLYLASLITTHQRREVVELDEAGHEMYHASKR
ncbi:hypothetical protein BBJ29_007961 [Phytophthora kernoviae]|uniref:Cytochrome c peroxidase, mitochondrial n=1 Tax=Phytophthora kernoviae TaxID=325452 RepID=A0A3F2RFT2_9STRA|nr:hypothetical protein BBJ29_007961 [Phytophthora kernoviae]RLN54589.1 hypothetical protein BBP00_00008876 [Phytophthora kernoviae]